MPRYGSVWRQTVSPVLWVKGVHDDERLVVHDLRTNPAPISIGADDDIHGDILDLTFEEEPVLYDSDEEEEQAREE